jgi:hypothetical protein
MRQVRHAPRVHGRHIQGASLVGDARAVLQDGQAMSGLFGDCPTWLDETAWAAYCEWRDKMPKARRWTPYARHLILLELAKLREAGESPTACLQQSLRNSWLDVFPVRKPANFRELPANDSKPPPQVDTTRSYLDELEQHKRAATMDSARDAREKVRRLADSMRRRQA